MSRLHVQYDPCGDKVVRLDEAQARSVLDRAAALAAEPGALYVSILWGTDVLWEWAPNSQSLTLGLVV